MNNEHRYPCQIAVLKKSIDREIGPFEPLVGLPEPQRSMGTRRIYLDCPITGRHCRYHYPQSVELAVVKDIAIDCLCGSCEYRKKTKEEKNEHSKYKR